MRGSLLSLISLAAASSLYIEGANALCPDGHDEAVDCRTPAAPCDPGEPLRLGRGDCSGAMRFSLTGLPMTPMWRSQGGGDEGLGNGFLAGWSLSVKAAGEGTLALRSGDGSTIEFLRVGTSNVFASSLGDETTIEVIAGGYRLKAPGGGSTTFTKAIGEQRFISAQRDRSGRTIEFEWEERLPISIRDSLTGRKIELENDGNHITSLVDSRGRRYALTYSGGNLSEVAFPDGKKTGISWTQDGSNLVTSVTNPVTNRTRTMTYFANGVLKTLNEGSSSTQIEYPGRNTVIRREFGSTGKALTVSREQYQYGYLTQSFEGSAEKADPQDPSTMVSTGRASYDPIGRLTASWDELGNRTEYFYSADGACQAGSTTAGDFNTYPKCIRGEDGSTVRVKRDAKSGRALEISTFAPDGRKMSSSALSYTTDGLLSSGQVTNALSGDARASIKISYLGDTEFPEVEETEQVQTFTYDAQGRVIGSSLPSQTVSYQYGRDGRVVSVVRNGIEEEYASTVDPSTGGVTVSVTSGSTTGRVNSNFDGTVQTSALSRDGIENQFVSKSVTSISQIGSKVSQTRQFAGASGAGLSWSSVDEESLTSNHHVVTKSKSSLGSVGQ